VNGVLIIDKPSGLTSHDVVNRVRRILDQRSVGHLGTLDPLATGILPLVIGNFTRLAQFYVNSEKSYEGTIRFGFSTDTYDAEGEPTSPEQTVALRREDLDPLVAKFHNLIQQTPPPFSAKKIKGVPAYKFARKQKEVTLQPVEVELKEFEILSADRDRATFRARVASGTYMRSIAHDIGQLLGCGAHLESLRRTQVAEFMLGDAHTLEELAAAEGKSGLSRATLVQTVDDEKSVPQEFPANTESAGITVEERPFQGRVSPDDLDKGCSRISEPLTNLFVHPRKLMPQMPAVTADEPTAARIRSGSAVNLPELSSARQVKVFAGQRDLIAIATRIAGTLFHPKIVLG